MAREVRPMLVARARTITGDAASADDIAQDALLRLWSMGNRLDGYDSPRSVAMLIARNLAIDHLRRQRPSSEILEFMGPLQPSPEEQMILREMPHEVEAILSQLPPAQAVIIRLRHVEELEIDEIAALVDSSPGAIRTSLSRARARIKEILAPKQSAPKPPKRGL